MERSGRPIVNLTSRGSVTVSGMASRKFGELGRAAPPGLDRTRVTLGRRPVRNELRLGLGGMKGQHRLGCVPGETLSPEPGRQRIRIAILGQALQHRFAAGVLNLSSDRPQAPSDSPRQKERGRRENFLEIERGQLLGIAHPVVAHDRAARVRDEPLQARVVQNIPIGAARPHYRSLKNGADRSLVDGYAPARPRV